MPAALPLYATLPFVAMLLAIAILPLAAPHWWEPNRNKLIVSAGLGLPVLVLYLGRQPTALVHMAGDYVSFVVLLGGLYAIAGGILLRGDLEATPAVNGTFLGAGALLASLIGTTGATMLLIRPLLQTNRERRHATHTVVFFIFLVSNVGGALTPLGDPPLFLGFLQGVPFFWTLSLGSEMLIIAGLVLAAYAGLDLWFWGKEDEIVRRRPELPPEPVRLEGAHNLLFLAGVLAAVVASGAWHPGEVSVLGVHQGVQNLARDAFLLAMLAASWLTTRRQIREANGYSWAPIQEVAILFAAIFATIIPVLAILKAGERGALAPLIQAVKSPAQFFWATGALSSFLDNAPTYLAFLSTALGRFTPGLPTREAITALIAAHPEYLKAISTGAVFMGANTYIGNAPNFMVKSIAEQNGIRMPSFGGYMVWSIVVLLPIFAIVTYAFFR
jgi:Na+/H+ antiporter NhaD/arsenite permease-like protein